MILPYKHKFNGFNFKDYCDKDDIDYDMIKNMMRNVTGGIHDLVYLNNVTDRVRLLHDENQVFDKGKCWFFFFGGLRPPMEEWI